MRTTTKQKTLRVLAALLVAVVFTGVITASARAEEPQRRPEGSVELDDRASARNIRETFRLDSSDEVIQATDSSDGTVDFLGIRLTEEENFQVQRQLALELRLEGLVDEISATVGDDFAGAWVDRDTRSIVVSTKGDLVEESREAISDLLGDADLEVRQVPRSLSDLREISGLVTFESDSYVVRSVGREPMANRVVVSVTGDVDAAVREMEEHFGDAVRVEEFDATPLSRTAGPPWKAGKKIEAGATSCTGAYGVQKNAVNYVLTAGHCKMLANPDISWDVGSNYLGDMTSYSWGVTDADVAMIKPTTSPSWLGQNCVYISASHCATVITYKDPTIGTTVCFSGATSGAIYCGTAALERDVKDFMFGWNGAIYDGVEATGFPIDTVCPGDSGAPVFFPSGSGSSQTAYGRGIVSYQSGGNCSSAPADLGIVRWSNIQRKLGIEGGCVGNWPDNAGCGSSIFSDISFNNAAWNATYWAATTGVDTGDAGAFHPKTVLKRGDAAAWLWRQAGSPSGYNPPAYTDVGPSHPQRSAIGWAVAQQYISGYSTGCSTGNPCFRPDNQITREEWAVALHRLAGLPPISPTYQPLGSVCDVPTSHPNFQGIMWAVKERIIRGIPQATGSSCVPNPNMDYSQRWWPPFGINRDDAINALYRTIH